MIFFSSKGIMSFHSCVETPKQNAVVERKHQHLLNVTRALLIQSLVPLCLWEHCIQTAVHIINRLPSLLLLNKSTFELLNKKKPNYSHLSIFSCLCYVSTSQYNRLKFDPRARACTFLIYPHGYKGYKLPDLESNKIHIVRHVVFHESIFPFASGQLTQMQHNCFDDKALPMSIPNTSTSSSVSHTDSHLVSTYVSHFVPNIISLPQKTRKTHAYLNDYHCYLAHFMATIQYPITYHITYERLEPNYIQFILSMPSHFDPYSFEQAMKC